MLSTSEKRVTQAKAQNLLREYGDFLTIVINEIRKQLDTEITGSLEEIALEYKRRQGFREGLTLLMQRLNSKSDERV